MTPIASRKLPTELFKGPPSNAYSKAIHTRELAPFSPVHRRNGAGDEEPIQENSLPSPRYTDETELGLRNQSKRTRSLLPDTPWRRAGDEGQSDLDSQRYLGESNRFAPHPPAPSPRNGARGRTSSYIAVLTLLGDGKNIRCIKAKLRNCSLSHSSRTAQHSQPFCSPETLGDSW
jgi:hypothetical protein